MWQGPFEKVTDYIYRIPMSYREDMKADGLFFTSEKMREDLFKDEACEQLANVSTLPGLAGPSLAMPDAHWGYGFPIGGVAATLQEEGGVVSPGGVGFDINCGVRLLRTSLTATDVQPFIKDITDAMFKNVPSGVGSKARIRVSNRDLDDILTIGAKWAVDQGYGQEKDLERMEENGGMTGADHNEVSVRAKARGLTQVGSLGAGNHFLEVQKVDEIYDPLAAKAMGIDAKDQVVVLIHTGSRGLGYQVCEDKVRELESHYMKDGRGFRSNDFNITVPDKQLVSAPLGTDEANSYLGAMRSAANYAWANRQLITHWVRESFSSVIKGTGFDTEMSVVYDVAHNIAKMEEHTIKGRRRMVCVHRKGATRAFGPSSEGVPSVYSAVGQPVLIPGDMGTASYLLAGTERAMELTFGSTCHGAGRVLSRSKAIENFRSNDIIRELSSRGIYVRAASPKVVAEEAPQAYKDVDAVVEVVCGAGISKRVARMVPMAVIKG
ncbi:MAG: RtcB family protein [Candidatus Thermoplasmatota archaeon]|jgi:tRNA-splicing ligase RtcB|nr:RtcB family protein [Candidatus Thermoplasmatota archaeon]